MGTGNQEFCPRAAWGRQLRPERTSWPCKLTASPVCVLKRVVTFWQAGRARPGGHAPQELVRGQGQVHK